MDLRIGHFLRDFTLLGLGIGGLAPCAVLFPLAYQGNDNLLVMLGPLALAGAAMGTVVGLVLYGLVSMAPERPLLLSPLGFPVGAVAGGLVGVCIGGMIHPMAVPIVGALGLLTGGFVLGLAWLPYLALKSAGRSGMPVVLTAAFGSPVLGALAMACVLGLSTVFNI